MYTPHPQYQHFPTIAAPQTFIPYQFPQRRTDTSKDDPHMPTITSVVQQITQELKQILKKDFNKKMVENTAFKRFETWWEEESCKENKNIEKEDSDISKGATKDNINVLLEANREHLYNNSKLDSLGLGLGLRASLPKMPSFRRKKMPSPVPEDEDTRKLSDNEEIVQDSDAEAINKPLRRVRTASSSSSSAESSVFGSSSSDSSSSDESSSDWDAEVAKRRIWRSPTPDDRTTPIPINDLSSPRNLSPISRGELSPIEKELSPKRDIITETKEEPMLVDSEWDRAPSEIPINEEKRAKSFVASDSDSELSEGEKEYLERRRKNTEYMEQIERERLELEKHKPKSPSPLKLEIKHETITEKGEIPEIRTVKKENYKTNEKDIDSFIEDIKAKETSAIDILTQMAAGKIHVSSEDENVEQKKKTERTSESSMDGSTPKSQVQSN